LLREIVAAVYQTADFTHIVMQLRPFLVEIAEEINVE